MQGTSLDSSSKRTLSEQADLSPVPEPRKPEDQCRPILTFGDHTAHCVWTYTGSNVLLDALNGPSNFPNLPLYAAASPPQKAHARDGLALPICYALLLFQGSIYSWQATLGILTSLIRQLVSTVYLMN